MSVIIRLQGLPWTASAMNIRHFFSGLNIPAGGVHIIGGEGGDAFIAFSSDDDARMAMKMNMGPLNGVIVQLFLSSKSEMQSVIEAARSGGPGAAASSSSSSSQGMAAVPGTMGQAQTGVPAVNSPMMQNQTPQMSGFQGMQAHGHGHAAMMGQKGNNFQSMQHHSNNQQQQQQQTQQPHMDMSQQGVGNTMMGMGGGGHTMMGGGGGGGHNMMGGGGGGGPNDWQSYHHGMGGMMKNNQGEGRSANMGQFHHNQNMMSGGGGPNDHFSRFQNFQHQQQAQQQAQHQPTPEAKTAVGVNVAQKDDMARQGRGLDTPSGKAAMESGGPAAGMMKPNRFAEPGMKPAWMVGAVTAGMNEKVAGQFSGMEDVVGMTKGFTPDQRSGSLGKEEAMVGQMGRGLDATGVTGFPKDRLGAGNEMAPELAGTDRHNLNSNAIPWSQDKLEDSFADKGRFDPNTRRNPEMFPPDSMGRRDGGSLGRLEGRRPNRFARDAPDAPDQPGVGGPYGMGMKRGEHHSGFPDRDDMRMPGQFPPRHFHGRPPGRGQGRMDGDRDQPSADDGLPSTRYPPDDDVLPSAPESGRFMPGRGLLDEPRGRGTPEDMRTPMSGGRRETSEDRLRMSDSRRGFPDDRRDTPEIGRTMSDGPRSVSDGPRSLADDSRPPTDDRRFRPRVSRFDGDSGMPMEQDERFPPNDGRFPPEDRGFAGNRPRFPPNDRFDPGMGRDRPGDGRFPPDRPFLEGDRFPLEESGRRSQPEDGPGMWPEDRRRGGDAGPGRPGDEMRFGRDREGDLRRDGIDGGPRGGDDRFMYGARGRGGPMRGMGRPGGPFPPDHRGGFPPDRHGGFDGGREADGDFPYRPDGDRWNRFDRNVERNRFEGDPSDQRPGFNPRDMGGNDRDKRALLNSPDVGGPGGPRDRDQRFDNRDMGPGTGGRWPDYRDTEGFDPQMDEGFGGDGPPMDFDNRAGGPRGRGGPMMDRGGPRGRGGRGGMPPFGRGREREVDPFSEEQGQRMVEDVDNRMVGERFPNTSDQFPQGVTGPEGRGPPGPPGRPGGLLGDSPQIPRDGNKRDDNKSEVDSKRDVDGRASRRSDDRDRDRDRRHYDDRRGRDGRDDRDRYSYRGRYDRDRERDRDRRRSRSRSRERERRSSRDRDSRVSRDNRDRTSKDKTSSSRSDTDLAKADNAKTSNPKTPNPVQKSTRFLVIKNMPPTANFREVRRFFQPLDIPFDGIKMINGPDGNRTGQANVYLHRLDDAVKGQKRNGDRMEGRPLTIQFTAQEDFDKAVDSFVPNKQNSKPPSGSTPAGGADAVDPSDKVIRYIVQLKNLPLTVTRQDITTFFKNLGIEREGEAVYIEFNQEGVATGQGFVEFKTDFDYKKALGYDTNKLGVNVVRVTPGKEDEADKMRGMQGEMFQRAALRNIANKTGASPNASGPRPTPGPKPQQSPATKPPGPNGVGNDHSQGSNTCVHIQGLPLLATPHDIRDFFGDCQITTRGINIAHDGNGKPLGEGFVEFSQKVDVDKALKKDKTSLGRHIVAVKPISKKEMSDRLEGAKHRGGGPPPRPPTAQDNGSSSPSQPQPPPFGRPQISPAVSPFTKPPGMQDSSVRGNHPSPQQQQQQQNNNQRLPTPSQQQQQQQQNQQNQAKPPGGPDPKGPPHPNPQQQQQQRGGHPKDLAGNGGPGGPKPMGGAQHMALLQTPHAPPLVVAPGGGKSFPPGVLNSKWFYVRCQNFPLDIAIADIMQFFHQHRPIGESIRLHYSSEGQSTGNAVVGFFTAEEANRAMQTLNMQFCRNSPVSLHPA